MNTNKIGNRIREIRVDILDLSQRGLSEIIHINKSMISLYENGQRKPSRETVEKISKLSGISADYIMGISDSKYTSKDDTSELEKELLNTFNKVKSLPSEQQKKIRRILEDVLQLINLDKKS
ncbi:helix-turn-helix domain-containing protein [Bacillus sp. NPDC094106]|uniref:helix-turn-helix domain-containing protein n=1 Tax=Bacillus sp. NPDC094106 TaxID=3363949 RepID=UPI0037F925BE